MALERDLARWVAAGLIDGATAERIRAHEQALARPVWRWAVAATGVLSVGLGLLLLVAANWEDIPRWTKLGGHLLLAATAAAAVALAGQRGQRWTAEAALFLFACLILAGLPLHGQIYQLAGPSWQLLAGALLLSGPALLLHGRTALAGAALALLALAAAFAFLVATPDPGMLGQWPRLLPESLALAAPLLLLALGVMPGGMPDAGMARLLRAGPLWLLGLVAFFLAPVGWLTDVAPADTVRLMPLLIVPVPVAALALLLNQRWPRVPPRLLAALVAGPMLVLVAPLMVAHPADALWARLLGLLLALAALGWIAHAAADAGWRWLFNLTVALAALRLLAAYFELFGSLATTGFGMVGGGLLLIALAWGWRRVTRAGPAGP